VSKRPTAAAAPVAGGTIHTQAQKEGTKLTVKKLKLSERAFKFLPSSVATTPQAIFLEALERARSYSNLEFRGAKIYIALKDNEQLCGWIESDLQQKLWWRGSRATLAALRSEPIEVETPQLSDLIRRFFPRGAFFSSVWIEPARKPPRMPDMRYARYHPRELELFAAVTAVFNGKAKQVVVEARCAGDLIYRITSQDIDCSEWIREGHGLHTAPLNRFVASLPVELCNLVPKKEDVWDLDWSVETR
jgi:hypothetical protein